MKLSRVGKKPIILPEGVTVKISGKEVEVQGSLGIEKVTLSNLVKAELQENKVIVKPTSNSREARAHHGLFRMLIANAVEGVSKGFEKKLELVGIGFRAGLSGEQLELSLGFSHPITFSPPPGIKFKVEKNVITVFGTNKTLVGDTASRIRKLRPPEPYKGKGIRYLGEQIRRKAGKAGKAVGAK
jgi:large subunit ribosomal protein L6